MKKEVLKKKVDCGFEWLKGKKIKYSLILYMLFNQAGFIFAEENTNNTAEDKWNTAINFLSPWIVRAGLLTLVVGLLMYAEGRFQDRAEDKTKGGNVIIGGLIIAAIGGSMSTFLS